MSLKSSCTYAAVYAVAAVALWCLPGCGDDDNPTNGNQQQWSRTAPEQWRGVWRGTEQVIQIPTGPDQGQFDVEIRICEDHFERITLSGNAMFVPWTFSGDSTMYDASRAILNPQPPCTGSNVAQLVGFVEGDTLIYERVLSWDVPAECSNDILNTRTIYTAKLSRIATATTGCDTVSKGEGTAP